MTVERVEELVGYWGDYPPPHILVRGAVGYESSGTRKQMTPAELAAKFGGKRGA